MVAMYESARSVGVDGKAAMKLTMVIESFEPGKKKKILWGATPHSTDAVRC